MIKKINNYFFDEEATTSDLVYFYGTLSFGTFVSLLVFLAVN